MQKITSLLGLRPQTSYRGLAPGPNWGTSNPQIPDEPLSQMLDPPLYSNKLCAFLVREYNVLFFDIIVYR